MLRNVPETFGTWQKLPIWQFPNRVTLLPEKILAGGAVSLEKVANQIEAGLENTVMGSGEVLEIWTNVNFKT